MSYCLADEIIFQFKVSYSSHTFLILHNDLVMECMTEQMINNPQSYTQPSEL